MAGFDSYNPSYIRRDVSGLEPALAESGSSLDSLGDVLPSTPYNPGNWNVPMPGPGSTVSSGSNMNWGKGVGAAIGAVPLIASLFAGNRGSITPQIGEIQRGAREMSTQGKALAAQGQQTLNPALQYFQNLLSGNPADVMAATAPERRRVIDQYDTARRSSGQFTPRGGGQASTQQQARAMEAGDLATLGAEARRGAANTTALLGQNLLQTGIGEQADSQQQLAQMLGPLFQQQQSDSQSTLGTIQGLASLAAMFI